MAVVFLTVEGNTAPAIQLTLKRNRQPIDLTGAAVALIIQNPKTKTVTNTGHQACSILEDEGGVIAYDIVDGDFANHNIDYRAEVKVTYSSGKIERIYETLTIDPREALEET